MTTTNGTPTAAETVQELNAKLDAALANPDMDVDRHQLRRELDSIAIAEGGEVGRLVARYHKVVETQIAALDASAPRRREEAKVVWEGEFDGFKLSWMPMAISPMAISMTMVLSLSSTSGRPWR